MSKITKHPLAIFSLTCFLTFCSLFVSESVFSLKPVKHWTRDFTSITYNSEEEAILIRFKFYDYKWGFYLTGHLSWCEFHYTTDGINWSKFMQAEIRSQEYGNSSWIRMIHILPDTDIRFYGCTNMNNGEQWPKDMDDIRLQLTHKNLTEAYLTTKWFTGEKYRNIKQIKLVGEWRLSHLNFDRDKINAIYDVTIPNKEAKITMQLKPTLNNPEMIDRAVNVYSESDEVVIKGEAFGETIQVYSVSGMLINSVQIQSDLTKIKLPAKQIYFVRIRETSYKVAL